MEYLFSSLRPAQWIKNFFIFLPLIFGKRLFVYPVNTKTVMAFFIFCMMTSVVYLVNDIIDIEVDKAHPTKRLRAIASGKVSILTATLAALVLGAASLFLSYALNPYFGIVLALFLIGNLLYSMTLKNIVIADVFCIAVFFYLRIKAGSVMAGVDLSHWIIFMIFFLALFLALIKRSKEPVPTQYNPDFIDRAITVISASIGVVYMLYTVDARTMREFGSDHLMYSIPFVYYGLFRYLYLVRATGNDGDPTRILLSDRAMQINIILWIGVCIAVIYFGL